MKVDVEKFVDIKQSTLFTITNGFRWIAVASNNYTIQFDFSEVSGAKRMNAYIKNPDGATVYTIQINGA